MDQFGYPSKKERERANNRFNFWLLACCVVFGAVLVVAG